MKKIGLIILLVSLLPTIIVAHLCNDVFVQAKDNLAVKVDIRDGQLRIGDRATFRVYLLNTMDQAIDEINLEVITDDFTANVSPSPKWKSFPVLPTHQKQYFNVELTRKSGTEAGKYTIDLRLFGGGYDFKTVNIDEVLCVMTVPENSPGLKIDGDVSSAEWKNSLLCTSLYEYRKGKSDYMENIPSNIQTRFRFSHDQEMLYCLIDFMKSTKKDIAKIYVATGYESEPIVIIADLQKKRAFIDRIRDIPLAAAVNENKMELALPLNILQVTNQQSFYVNVTRSAEKVTTYWLGNEYSVTDPVIYARFVF